MFFAGQKRISVIVGVFIVLTHLAHYRNYHTVLPLDRQKGFRTADIFFLARRVEQ
jgi:hypothetical protein